MKRLFVHKTTYSVQLPYIAGHSLKESVLNLPVDNNYNSSKDILKIIKEQLEKKT